ncbi:hypothetical protein R3P38DRAFT_2774361 [Favolaschia claudopus]|uniref:Uncharacterized protein n=1 Tax=Favolaschia claudopus TaxID=2862362 RepID=A0AAW0C2U4_9AGAR
MAYNPRKMPKRAPSLERAFRRIRCLGPRQQQRALVKHKHDLPYLREGEGYIYWTAQLPAKVVHGQKLQQIQAELIMKWGESTRLTGRQEDYRRCETGRIQMWIGAVHVERRLLTARGYRRVRFVDPCGCGRRHREYVYMGSGSFADMESVMRQCLREGDFGVTANPSVSTGKPCVPADEGPHMLEDDTAVG